MAEEDTSFELSFSVQIFTKSKKLTAVIKCYFLTYVAPYDNITIIFHYYIIFDKNNTTYPYYLLARIGS